MQINVSHIHFKTWSKFFHEKVKRYAKWKLGWIIMALYHSAFTRRTIKYAIDFRCCGALGNIKSPWSAAWHLALPPATSSNSGLLKNIWSYTNNRPHVQGQNNFYDLELDQWLKCVLLINVIWYNISEEVYCKFLKYTFSLNVKNMGFFSWNSLISEITGVVNPSGSGF